jgi:flagella basal body P-ring formation protein FlgA
MVSRILRICLLLGLAGAVVRAVEPALSARPFAQDEIQRHLSGLLKDHFTLEGDLAVELLLLRPGLVATKTASDWQVQVTEFPAVAGSSMMVRFRPVADGQALPEQTAVLRANLWRDAWYAKEPVAFGTTFDPAQFEAKRVDFFRDREAVAVGMPAVAYILSRGVTAGRLLTWRDLAKRPLVRKGEMVEVSATDGRLVVNLKGLVMQNGGQGDFVTVRNPDSKKDFSAYVIDENRVQVRF